MDLCACGCGMPVKVGRRFLQGHAARVRPRRALPRPSFKGQAKGKWPTSNAHLMDKPAVRPGIRKLILKGGTTKPGRLYWYGEYAATDKAAKKRAYQAARECAEVMRLLIMGEAAP